MNYPAYNRSENPLPTPREIFAQEIRSREMPIPRAHNANQNIDHNNTPLAPYKIEKKSALNPTITIDYKGKKHSFNFTPWLSITAVACFMLLFISVIGSGAYLYLRDDLLSASLARQAQMQSAYEERIAALRSQVDIVTSRQLLDQQVVERRVSELMARQETLDARQSHVQEVVSQVNNKAQSAIKSSSDTPSTKQKKSNDLRLGSLLGTQGILNVNPPLPQSHTFDQNYAYHQPNSDFFNQMETSLKEKEQAQLAELNGLRESTIHKSRKLASILQKQGIRLPKETAMGGPLIELKTNDISFENSVGALNDSLKTLKRLQRVAKSLPHGSPVPGKKISSRFGSRRDPFTARRALHSGLDYRARRGAKVLATAMGTVIKAGRHGGYGNMIEIDHGSGITTRYAHLSKILVRKGQKIQRGMRIGHVGSTGRSTGPHLHYEVRRKGQALNPIHYVRLEKSIKPYL